MMAYCTIEDPEGHVDVIVFPELYRNSLSLLQKDTPVLIKGTVDKTEKGIKIVSTEISGLDSLEDRIGHKVEVNLTLPLSGPSRLQDLRSVILDDSNGKFPLFLRITHKKNAETLIATGIKISYENEVIRKIEEITGKGAVVFQ